MDVIIPHLVVYMIGKIYNNILLYINIMNDIIQIDNTINNQVQNVIQLIDFNFIELIKISTEKNNFYNMLSTVSAYGDLYNKLFHHIRLLESQQINLIQQNFLNSKQICLMIKYNQLDCFNINVYFDSYEYYYVLYKFNIYKYDLVNITFDQIKKIIMKNYLTKIITK